MCGFALALLAACVSNQAPGEGPASADRAERLLRQNNPTAAAQMYERLAADNMPPVSVDFWLAAARAWLTAGKPADAQRATDAAGTTLTAKQGFERGLLRTEILLEQGQFLPAWRQVAAIAEPREAADAVRLFRLKQQVALRAGQPLDAITAEQARERVSASDAERAAARRDLLAGLREASDRGVRLDPTTARDAVARGWLEMGQIAASAGRSPQGAAPAIQNWRTRYPGHPAGTVAFAEIVTPATATAPLPTSGNQSMALLLPLTGPQSTSAALVRDGFLTAIAEMPEAARPQVHVYDTGTLPVGTALQNAATDGAGFVVGPLTRAEVQTAIEQRVGGTPLLLLNNVTGDMSAGPGVYQYALAPEDEARQVARQALSAGQKRALLFVPVGDWGTRVGNAFTDELTRGGGQVVAHASYDPARNEFNAVITQALGVNESRARFGRVQQAVGTELQFEPRPRGDVDLIFAAGQTSLSVRQLRTQLNFFSAGDIPTYMTSDGLDEDPNANRDLKGMLYPELPWVLESSGPVADTRLRTQPKWDASGQKMSRLFAFGYDAAVLAVQLRARQPALPLQGLTGKLNLSPGGRIARELDWAQISGGVPKLMTPAPGP
ncbi:MAG: penicillin-binding protein activator [Pseudomonadota bacterium]